MKRFALTDSDKNNLFQGHYDVTAAVKAIRSLLEGPVDRTELSQQLQSIAKGISPYISIGKHVFTDATEIRDEARAVSHALSRPFPDIPDSYRRWTLIHGKLNTVLNVDTFKDGKQLLDLTEASFKDLADSAVNFDIQQLSAESSRRPLDHKKFLDMLIDDVEDKFIELMEGTRAHTANIDNYIARVGQALDDDFQTQFYNPAFKGIREAGRYWDVQMGQIETTTVLTNNRVFAKVSPQATMEFDLPKRDILINEAFKSAQAAYDDYGALLGDPTFLALTKMHRGQPPAATYGGGGSVSSTRNLLPGLPSSTDESLVAQNRAVSPDFPSALEALIPDPAIYKFETGTGYEIRPVIQPDGQAVVFHFNYMYTTNIREPVRADEKHLGRVKRHFIDTDVQTGNYELREVSRYQVALKASRTSRGVPFLEDLPGAGILFRPMPNQESSLQQNLILAQTVIFPTLFDLMGLRWAPAVADLDALRLQEADFVTRARQRVLRERVFDYSSQQVDDFLRIPQAERRSDLYRSQETTPSQHPNGYNGPGLKIRDGTLREGYDPAAIRPDYQYIPGVSKEGAVRNGVHATDEVQMQEEFEPPHLSAPIDVPSPYQEDRLDDHGPGGMQQDPSPLQPPEDVDANVPPPSAGRTRSLFNRTPISSGTPLRSATPDSKPPIKLQSHQVVAPSGVAAGLRSPQQTKKLAPKKNTNTPVLNPPTLNPAAKKQPITKPAAAMPIEGKNPPELKPPSLLPTTSRLQHPQQLPVATSGKAADDMNHPRLNDIPIAAAQRNVPTTKTSRTSDSRQPSNIVQVKASDPEPTSKTRQILDRLSFWSKKR